jgi:diadenosine tetraphosphatase ApaH/serine/threonine PP2A family protein phosphatase
MDNDKDKDKDNDKDKDKTEDLIEFIEQEKEQEKKQKKEDPTRKILFKTMKKLQNLPKLKFIKQQSQHQLFSVPILKFTQIPKVQNINEEKITKKIFVNHNYDEKKIIFSKNHKSTINIEQFLEQITNQYMFNPKTKINSISFNFIIKILNEKYITIDEFSMIHSILLEKKDIVQQPIILNLDTNNNDYILIGDLHGSLNCTFFHFLVNGGIQENKSYLFLGDYLDRGPNGLEIVSLLLLLRLLFPDKIYLILGNHETQNIYSVYGTKQEFEKKLGISSINYWEQTNLESPSIYPYYDKLNFMLSLMSLISIIDEKIFCCHGCPNETTNLKEIQNFNLYEYLTRYNDANYYEYKEEDKYLQINDIIWSDPVESSRDTSLLNLRGVGKSVPFTMSNKFLSENNLQLIIRAHQCVMDGYNRDSYNCYTIFGQPNYCGMSQNLGAFCIVTRDKKLIFITFTEKDVFEL